MMIRVMSSGDSTCRISAWCGRATRTLAAAGAGACFLTRLAGLVTAPPSSSLLSTRSASTGAVPPARRLPPAFRNLRPFRETTVSSRPAPVRRRALLPATLAHTAGPCGTGCHAPTSTAAMPAHVRRFALLSCARDGSFSSALPVGKAAFASSISLLKDPDSNTPGSRATYLSYCEL